MKTIYQTKMLKRGVFLIYFFSLIFLAACKGENSLPDMIKGEEAAAAKVEKIEFVEVRDSPIFSTPPRNMPRPTESMITVPASVYVWSLRVRSGAGTDTHMIGGLIYEDTLSLVGRNGDGSWVKFSEGWVASEYLVLEGEIGDLPILTGDIDQMVASEPSNSVAQQASTSGTEEGEVLPALRTAPFDSP